MFDYTDPTPVLRARALRLCGHSLLAFISLITLACCQMMYVHHSRRVYFPFERRQSRRNHLLLSHLPALRHDVNKTRKMFEMLTDVMVHQYIRFHKRQRFRKTSRKLIYTGYGNMYGLGDRFRGILHAYLCAVLSERVLLIAWTEPFPLSLIFQSARGINVMYDPELDGYGALSAAAGNKSDLEAARKFGGSQSWGTNSQTFPWCKCGLNNLGLLLSPHRTVVIRSETPPSLRRLFRAVLANKDLSVSRALAPLALLWRDMSADRGDDTLFALIFHNILRPAPEFLNMLARHGPKLRAFIPMRLRPFRRKSSTLMSENRTRGHISVHARLGYGLNESKEFAWRFNLQRKGGNLQHVAACLAKRAAKLADDMDMPDPQKFYLATDTAEFSEMFKRELRSRSKDPIIGEIVSEKMHSKKMNKNSAEDRNVFLSTAADLFFLSAGEAMLSLPSGFANLARWFGEMPHRVIAVATCVKEGKLNLREDKEFNLTSYYSFENDAIRGNAK